MAEPTSSDLLGSFPIEIRLPSSAMQSCLMVIVGLLASVGCRPSIREDLDYSYNVEQTWPLDEISMGQLVQFESVPCDLFEVSRLRTAISQDNIARGRDVLIIGSGTGLIAVHCCYFEADRVIATDVQPAAIANTDYNAAVLVPDYRIDTRLRPASKPEAYSALNPQERFDLVLTHLGRQQSLIGDSKDPAEQQQRSRTFLKTLLSGLPTRLRTGGRCIVLCNTLESIEQLEKTTSEITTSEIPTLELKKLDDRELADLKVSPHESRSESSTSSAAATFTPAMMWEVRVSKEQANQDNAESAPKTAPSDQQDS